MARAISSDNYARAPAIIFTLSTGYSHGRGNNKKTLTDPTNVD
jgi:hypothetical protein